MAVRNISVLILYDADGKILLQHRSKNATRLPDHWAFFGGGIEQDEGPEEALKREIEEELSLEINNFHLLVTQKFTYKEDNNTKYVFVKKYDNETLVLGEGQSMGWFLPEETSGLKMVDHDRSIIEEVSKYLKTTNNSS